MLSAAHCTFTSALKQATHVKLGDVRRGQNNINTYSYEIGERLKHPDYKYSSIDNDIALFKLAVVVTLNAYVRPICLPHLDEITKSATATGWGQLGAFDHQSKVLLKVNLDIFNQSSCQKSYDKSGKTANGIDYVTKICAGSYEKMKDTCGGDSGK